MAKSYYIHCGLGSDADDGRSENTSWKSFAPLAEQVLEPGDSVQILAPGSFDTSLWIKDAIGSKASPIQITFAPGYYDFHPAALQKRCYNISNNNEEPDVPKSVAVLIENSKNVIVSGTDARIVCRAKMISICIDHSESVSINGLAVDYHRPTVSEFTVTAATDETADITIHPDSRYAVNDGSIIWIGEGWDYSTGLAQELIPETGQIWRRKDPLLNLRIEELEPGKIRAHGDHSMITGRVFQLRNTYRDCVGIFVRRSKRIGFQSLNLYYLHGMGIVGQFSEDITLEKVVMAPEEGRGRTCSVWADSTHFSGCRGKITYRDCVFDGAHDDAINVHGTHLQIQEVVSQTSIRLRFMHRQTYGFMAVNPGDAIDFIRWDSMKTFGTSRVSQVDVINPHELRVTFENPIPADVRVKDVIENVTWTPSVEVTGCVVKRIPTRGFLITTRKKVIVTGNHFVRIYRNGINIESDSSNWFESGCVRDMTISDNRFEECGGDAILISPRHTVPNPSVHQNIRITGNTFILPEAGSAVKAAGTSGLEIIGNTIELTTGTHDRNVMITNDCDSVTISNNVFERKMQETSNGE